MITKAESIRIVFSIFLERICKLACETRRWASGKLRFSLALLTKSISLYLKKVLRTGRVSKQDFGPSRSAGHSLDLKALMF
jgi:hypothetical protein